jgi:hypothetical protein
VLSGVVVLASEASVTSDDGGVQAVAETGAAQAVVVVVVWMVASTMEQGLIETSGTGPV